MLTPIELKNKSRSLGFYHVDETIRVARYGGGWFADTGITNNDVREFQYSPEYQDIVTLNEKP